MTPMRLRLSRSKFSAADGFLGRHQGVLGEGVVLAGLGPVQVIQRVEALDFAGKTGLELAGVEVGDGGRPTHAGAQGAAEGVGVVGNGRQRAHAGHNHTF
jgi:hypothetical protein